MIELQPNGTDDTQQLQDAADSHLDIRLSEGTFNILILSHGWKLNETKIITDDLIEILQTHGEVVLAAILARKMSLRDYSSILKEQKERKRPADKPHART